MRMKICAKLLLVLSIVSIFTINLPYYNYGVDAKETQKQEQRSQTKNNKNNSNNKNNKNNSNNSNNKNNKNNKNNTIETSITSEGFANDLNPDNIGSTGEKLASPFVNVIREIVKKVLRIIQVIGGFLMVISFALFGFGMVASGNKGLAGDLGIFTTPNSKENLLKFGRNLLIGSALLFASSTIVQFVFKAIN